MAFSCFYTTALLWQIYSFHTIHTGCWRIANVHIAIQAIHFVLHSKSINSCTNARKIYLLTCHYLHGKKATTVIRYGCHIYLFWGANICWCRIKVRKDLFLEIFSSKQTLTTANLLIDSAARNIYWNNGEMIRICVLTI